MRCYNDDSLGAITNYHYQNPPLEELSEAGKGCHHKVQVRPGCCPIPFAWRPVLIDHKSMTTAAGTAMLAPSASMLGIHVLLNLAVRQNSKEDARAVY